MLNNMLNNFDVDEDETKTRTDPGRIKAIELNVDNRYADNQYLGPR